MLRVHAAEVETELRHVLRPPSEDDPEAFDELRVQRATEPDAPLEFVPVAADVSPQSQLALFAGGTPVISARGAAGLPVSGAAARRTRRGCPRSSGASCCATSAGASSGSCRGATAAHMRRSTAG